jgi:hypothetical protein
MPDILRTSVATLSLWRQEPEQRQRGPYFLQMRDMNPIRPGSCD